MYQNIKEFLMHHGMMFASQHAHETLSAPAAHMDTTFTTILKIYDRIYYFLM